jgi:hypothetical protein
MRELRSGTRIADPQAFEHAARRPPTAWPRCRRPAGRGIWQPY